MAKTRLTVPKAIREAVLKEFNHRCAICGTDRPQVHHIDEDPSNNDLLNLIPLCPNCHLVDQHNPTIPMDPEKLRLFREFKDPTILRPQFHPLFKRMKFLNLVKSDSDVRDLDAQCNELTEFIAVLEMGAFYSKRIGELLKKPPVAIAPVHYDRSEGWSSSFSNNESKSKQYMEQLMSGREQVYSLIVELLRFQSW